MIYDTFGYIFGVNQPRHELRAAKEPSVGRSLITAVIKELSKIAWRGQRAGYNDVLQRVMDRTIRYGPKVGRREERD